MQEGPNNNRGVLQLRSRSVIRTTPPSTPSRKRKMDSSEENQNSSSPSKKFAEEPLSPSMEHSYPQQEKLIGIISSLESLSNDSSIPSAPLTLNEEIVQIANQIRGRHPERKLPSPLISQGQNNNADGPLANPYEDPKGNKLSYSERSEIMRKKLNKP